MDPRGACASSDTGSEGLKCWHCGDAIGGVVISFWWWRTGDLGSKLVDSTSYVLERECILDATV